MKILEDKYPLGSLKGQRTPGRYIDGTLKQNIDILAKSITKDMTYLGVISSSTLEVGTGKSVFVQQVSECYLDAVNRYHNLNLELTMNNIVFRPRDIIERSFKVPQYSIVICDEWEDIHYWSELGITLRKFFRKCRQLNLFILIIIPNFFQLPMSYAISRSVFFIDVRFSGEFNRGYFSFYNFLKKKLLYIKGKKTQNYDVIQPNFTGRFVDGYVVNEKEYRQSKLNDLMSQEKEEKQPVTTRQVIMEKFKRIHEGLPEITFTKLTKVFGIDRKTGYTWLKELKEGGVERGAKNVVPNINYPIIQRNNLLEK